VVKINNKRKIKYYLKDYDSGNSSQKSAAKSSALRQDDSSKSDLFLPWVLMGLFWDICGKK
jgi:hypothetical protein